MQLIDTHAHLNDPSFGDDLTEVVERASLSGVDRMIAVGIDIESSLACIELASKFDSIYAAVGIQPNCCHEFGDQDWKRITELASMPKVVALGETGLDRYWDRAPFEKQQDFFQRHLAFSQSTGLPFIVHMRECEDDVIDALKQAHRNGPLRGVMHSFTGTIEGAMQCMELGLMISFAGMVTYKKADDLREVAKQIPLESILIETDCPYLSPHPKRGQRPNEPSLVLHTAECLAECRGESLEEFSQATSANALRLFDRIDDGR